jgi:DNA polymerase (family 10)
MIPAQADGGAAARPRAMENAQIADILDEIADLLDLKDANQFRIRSYRNASRTVRGLPDRLEDMAAEGKDLSDLPNIGKSTAEKIRQILDTGTCGRLEELREELPAGLTEVMRVEGMGPKKAMALHKALGIGSLEELKSAAEAGKIRDLEGFGEKTEQKIAEGIKTLSKTSGRILYAEAAGHVESLRRHMAGLKSVRRWEVAGSFRRAKETIGDLDVLVLAGDRGKATEHILAYDAVADVVSRGSEKVTVRLTSGLQVDFRFFEPESFGAAMLYFTGSKAHNIALRRVAQDREWKLNEYGLFKGDTRLAGKDEEGVYARLDLPWIAPELREDTGEIDAAAGGELPALVELDDIRGDLQSHTTASDGNNSIREMARAAKERGYDFFAVTDHSKRVTMARGLDDDRCRRHADAIRKVNDEIKGMWLMAGIEVDILKSGKLDLKPETLERLDWVVASIHYDRNLDEKRMTERIVKAVESGAVHCLGHPLGRIIGRREPIAFDAARVFEACAANNVYVEINAQPDRLDLPDAYCREAAAAGVKFTLGTDAHKLADMEFLKFGVNVARRGWLEKRHILNTLTAAQLRKTLKRR